LHGAPGHGLHLPDEGVAARTATEVARHLHPVPHGKYRVQMQADARKQVAQHLLEGKTHHRRGNGPRAQQRTQVDADDPMQDEARRREIEHHHQQVPRETWGRRAPLAQ